MNEESETTDGPRPTFTMVYDGILEGLGHHAALVHGLVLRYSMMDEDCCFVSVRRMAKELGMNKDTIVRQLRRLVEGGYLQVEWRHGQTSIYWPSGTVRNGG